MAVGADGQYTGDTISQVLSNTYTTDAVYGNANTVLADFPDALAKFKRLVHKRNGIQYLINFATKNGDKAPKKLSDELKDLQSQIDNFAKGYLNNGLVVPAYNEQDGYAYHNASVDGSGQGVSTPEQRLEEARNDADLRNPGVKETLEKGAGTAAKGTKDNPWTTLEELKKAKEGDWYRQSSGKVVKLKQIDIDLANGKTSGGGGAAPAATPTTPAKEQATTTTTTQQKKTTSGNLSMSRLLNNFRSKYPKYWAALLAQCEMGTSSTNATNTATQIMKDVFNVAAKVNTGRYKMYEGIGALRAIEKKYGLADISGKGRTDYGLLKAARWVVKNTPRGSDTTSTAAGSTSTASTSSVPKNGADGSKEKPWTTNEQVAAYGKDGDWVYRKSTGKYVQIKKADVDIAKQSFSSMVSGDKGNS